MQLRLGLLFFLFCIYLTACGKNAVVSPSEALSNPSSSLFSGTWQSKCSPLSSSGGASAFYYKSKATIREFDIENENTYFDDAACTNQVAASATMGKLKFVGAQNSDGTLAVDLRMVTPGPIQITTPLEPGPVTSSASVSAAPTLNIPITRISDHYTIFKRVDNQLFAGDTTSGGLDGSTPEKRPTALSTNGLEKIGD